MSNVLHHLNAFLVFHCLSGMTHTQLPIADTVLRGLSPSTIINKADQELYSQKPEEMLDSKILSHLTHVNESCK